MNRKTASVVFVVLAGCITLIGCAGQTAEGKRYWAIHLRDSPCEGASQVANEASATIKYLDQLHLEGKISAIQLINYRDNVAALQNQSAQACDFFNTNRITFDQYQSEMREIRASLNEIPTQAADE